MTIFSSLLLGVLLLVSGLCSQLSTFSAFSASALSVEDAVAMRADLEQELREFKKKDREARVGSSIPRRGGKNQDRPDLDEAGSNIRGQKRKTPEELGLPPLAKSGPDARAEAMMRKKLAVKLNILNLAEKASEEDLDQMLQIYEDMVKLNMPPPPTEGKPKEPADAQQLKLELKMLRDRLDKVAEKYGGLKAGRHTHARKQPEGLRAFTEQEAQEVKELRRKIKLAQDPEEEKKLREELKVKYSDSKFKMRDDARRRKEAKRAEIEGDMTDRKAAREAARRAKREGKVPNPLDPKRLTRPDRGKGIPLKEKMRQEKMRKGKPGKPGLPGKPGITGRTA